MSNLKKLTNNIKYNAVSQILSVIVNFILFPFIVFHAGKELYGAYLLVVSFTGYLGLMDFGVGGATIKYIAEYTSKKDDGKIIEVISASFSFFAIIGILAAILLFVFSFHFNLLFKMDPYNSLIVKRLLWIASISSLLIWPGKIFDYALQGLQRYDRFAMNNTLFIALTAISAWLIFTNKLGIVCYLGVSSALTILKFLSAYMIINKSILMRHIKFPYFNKEMSKVIFGFSFYLFLGSLASIIIFNFDNVIIGMFVSVSAVTLYSAGFNLQQGFRLLNSLIGGPLFPAYAELEGRSEYEKQKTLLFRGSRHMTFIFVPLVIITVIFARFLINAWLGKDFSAGIVSAQILITFWIFNGILEIGSGMLTAKGFVKENFKITFLTAAFNFILSIILVRYIGIAGVALGTTIPMVLIYSPLMMRQICRVFKISFREYFINVLKENITVMMLAALLSVLVLGIFPSGKLWVVIFEIGAVYIVTLSASYYWLLKAKDRTEICAMIGF